MKADKEKYKTVLIVLNRPIDCPIVFDKLIAAHDTIICSDGGANRLKKYFQDKDASDENFDKPIHPDYIIGDLDSISDDTRKYYEE